MCEWICDCYVTFQLLKKIIACLFWVLYVIKTGKTKNPTKYIKIFPVLHKQIFLLPRPYVPECVPSDESFLVVSESYDVGVKNCFSFSTEESRVNLIDEQG